MLSVIFGVVLVTGLFGLSNGVFVGSSPFDGTTLYIPKYYQEEVQTSIDAHSNDASMLKVAQNISVAFWMDTMSKIDNASEALADASSKQNSLGIKYTFVTIVYDLPDRDCAALSSNGEILCEDSACTDGINEYKTNYIDPIISMFKKYSDVNIVVVLEPDSLPNLATNSNVQKCQQAETAYKTCVSYAIEELSQLSNVAIYIDAAHGGWLGWTNNQDKFAVIIKEVLNDAITNIKKNKKSVFIDNKEILVSDIDSSSSLIRGFASNTANYQPLGSMTSTYDPCNLESQYNFCINEAIYISQMSDTFAKSEYNVAVGGWVTDTSRNGVLDERSDCSNWCNIAGAGLGERPTTDTSDIESLTGNSLIDALLWVKVPGESDGTSNTSSPRYDAHCGSSDSTKPAPEAGTWFDSYFVDLCQNAVPSLE